MEMEPDFVLPARHHEAAECTSLAEHAVLATEGQQHGCTQRRRRVLTFEWLAYYNLATLQLWLHWTYEAQLPGLQCCAQGNVRAGRLGPSSWAACGTGL